MTDKKCVDCDNTCEFCGKSFKTIYSLKVHMETAKYCLKIRSEDIIEVVKNTAKNSICEYCDFVFTQKSSLRAHHNSCLKYKDHLIETKTKEIRELEKNHEKELEELKTKIAKLEKTIEYNKGYVEGYKTVKPPKQITNNNNTVVQKLKALPVTTIAPLTISLIKSNLENYTYDMYKLAELGVVQFMKSLTILTLDDGTIEKNYVSSDRSRNAFHRFVVGGEWKSDAGARFINTILDQIVPKVKEHDSTLAEEGNELGIRDTMKDILLKMHANLLPFYRGVTKEKSKDRVTVLTKIRTAIKDINHIDMLSIC